jgi:hypothetical protein
MLPLPLLALFLLHPADHIMKTANTASSMTGPVMDFKLQAHQAKLKVGPIILHSPAELWLHVVPVNLGQVRNQLLALFTHCLAALVDPPWMPQHLRSHPAAHYHSTFLDLLWCSSASACARDQELDSVASVL